MKFEVFQEQGKGRRRCPALEGWITARTCGKHRLNDINCPASCKYLDQHERYQHARVAEEFHQAWVQKIAPFYEKRDGVALDFLIAIEFALYQILRATPSLKDGEAFEALTFLHRQLSPIQVVEAVGSSLGKHLVQAATEYQKEHPRFDAESAQSIVDVLIELMKSDQPQTRQVINGFMGHLEENFDLSSLETKSEEDEVVVPSRIITPK